MIQLYILSLFLSFTDNKFLQGVDASTTFTLVNNCPYTIWPVILSAGGSTPIPTNGFALQEGDSYYIQTPSSSWRGIIWSRTHCSENSTGKFTCLTGDCGSGKIECDGGTFGGPATLAEFTINSFGMGDFYDVSLVDGYNIPLLVAPQVANCTTTGCVTNINSICPGQLRVTAEREDAIACKSPCNTFNTDEYCCKGAYNTQSTCKPTNFSRLFKKSCPQAISFAFDDQTTTFTCSNVNYTITFCPLPSPSQKSSPGSVTNGNSNSNNNITIPSINSTIVYDGVSDFNTTEAASTCINVLRPPSVAGALAITIAMWRLCHTH